MHCIHFGRERYDNDSQASFCSKEPDIVSSRRITCSIADAVPLERTMMGQAILCPAAVAHPEDEEGRWLTCCCSWQEHFLRPEAADSRQPVLQEAEPVRTRRIRHRTMPAQLAEADSRVLLQLLTRHTTTELLRTLRMMRQAGCRTTSTGPVRQEEGNLMMEVDQDTMKHRTRRRTTKVSLRHSHHS